MGAFLTRDLYNGALDDMALGADPGNTNWYTFAGGTRSPALSWTGTGGSPDRAGRQGQGSRDGGRGVRREHKATIAGVATVIAVTAGCRSPLGPSPVCEMEHQELSG